MTSDQENGRKLQIDPALGISQRKVGEEQLAFPDDVIPSPKTPKKRLGRRIGVGLTIANLGLIFGSATYGAVILTRTVFTEIYPNPNDPTLPPHREDSVAGLESYYGFDKSNPNWQELIVDNYRLAKTSFTSWGNYELITDYSGSTLDYIKRGREALLVDGANSINKISGQQTFDIDKDKGTITYSDEGLVFNFGNTYHEFLAGAIMDQILDLNNPNNKDKDKSTASLNDLVWLSHQSFDIEFLPDSYSFPDIRTLINTARIYRTYIDFGYPMPDKTTFVPYSPDDQGGAWIQGKDITVTGINGTGLIHEMGHLLAFNSEKFSQDTFNKIFLKSLEDNGISEDDQRAYVSSAGLPGAEDPFSDEYAEAISKYFTDGAGFRAKLRELWETDVPAYRVLKAQYDFAEASFEGNQYSQDGEVFVPIIGDVFQIGDPDKVNPSIPLRSEPKYDSTTSFTVFRGEQVKIIGGPGKMLIPATGEEETVWKIQSVMGYQNGLHDEGWVRELWFDFKVKQ